MIDAITHQGKSVLKLSREKPILLVFLRQFGCPFCREMMTDLAEKRKEIEARGVGIVLVHMTNESFAKRILSVYELEDLPRVSDPEQVFYDSFGLERGSIWQIFGLKTWFRMMNVSFLKGHFLGKTKGDQYQLPGIFLLENEEVQDSFKHRTVSDRAPFYDIARKGQKEALYA